MQLSLVFPVYNSSRFIDECLDSLENQSIKDFEIVIIDDCSTDNTREILKQRGYKFYKNEKNLGFAKTINKGISLSKGDYVAFIDHDIVYEKDFFKKMLSMHSDIVSGRYYYYKQKDKIRALSINVNPITGKTKVLGRDETDNGQYDSLKEVEAAPAGGLMVKKTVFSDIGLFSDKLIMYFVDVDFCHRARKKGYKIMISSARCWHKKEEKEILTEEQEKRYFHDKKIFMRKYPIAYMLTRIQLFLNRMA